MNLTIVATAALIITVCATAELAAAYEFELLRLMSNRLGVLGCMVARRDGRSVESGTR
jgi:hypothetical protein